MDFQFSTEQGLLRDTLASYLADHYDFEARRAAVQSAAGWRPQVWNAFAKQLDILGASFPEALRGQGGGAVENGIVMEELGKALVVEPYLGTVVIGGGFLKRADAALASEFVPRIIAGEVLCAFACAEPQARYALTELKTTATRIGGNYLLSGQKSVVIGAAWATHYIVTARESDGVGVFLVDRNATGIRATDYPTVDGGRASDLVFEQVSVPAARRLGGLSVLEQVVDEAICAVCAESVGGMRRMLADTVSYAIQRKQFGVPIASFQVLQHRMADMYAALEQSAALTQVATLKLGAAENDRALAVSAAKVQVGNASKFIGQAAIQIHGGMGITEELALGHYFRRATVIGSLFGSNDFHLRRYARLSLSAAA